jgi:hypothetical protein
MRYAILAGKLLVQIYLVYLLYVLAVAYEPSNPGFHPPFVLFVVDWVDLFIHEAGHLVFRIFGQVIYFAGGSIMQVLLPAVAAIVTWRNSPRWVSLPMYWTGESLVNVSVYIKDAPYKKLHLIGKNLIHDWNWLLGGDQDSAEILGEAVFVLGLLVCCAGIIAGVWFAIERFREDMGGTLRFDD